MLRLANHSQPRRLVTCLVPNMPSQQKRMQSSRREYQPVPALPVPKLRQSLDLYLKSLKPIVTDEASLKKTQEYVEDFYLGEGPRLQRLLEKHADGKGNWLTDWWIEVGYLSYRLPSSVHVSPAIAFPFNPNIHSQADQLQYAAKLVHHAITFRNLIATRALPQDMAGKSPQCMTQYDLLFGTSRVPAVGIDKARGVADNPKDRQHIIVAHNNLFFTIPVCHEDGAPLSPAQVLTLLEAVVKASPESAIPDPSQTVGVLTTEHRDTWAPVYDSIVQLDAGNQKNMLTIQNALFLLALDQNNPGLPTQGEPPNRSQFIDEGRTRLAERGIHGCGTHANSANRWFDKTLQLFVASDGGAGCIQEHTVAEGPPTVKLTDYCISKLSKDVETLTPQPVPSGLPPMEQLQWKLSKEHREAILQAGRNINALADRLDLKNCEMTQYGKEAIKSARLSPDAYIQVAFQLAYHRMYGRNPPTYESGSTRLFQRGRTDTIRSATIASDAFARHCAASDDVSMEKATMLRNAIDAHKEYTKLAITGQAYDRHFLGLRLIAKQHGISMPAIFNDPNYAESLHYRVSTSQVPSAHDSFLSFGPVVDDGYGICYNPRKNSLLFTITSWRDCPTTDSQRFGEHLERALHFMRKLLDVMPPAAKL